MGIQHATVEIIGRVALLQNNPQTVDRFNLFSKAMAKINAKKTKRTDQDYLDLRDLEMRSKIYWDDEIGIYVPTTWVTSSIASNSFRVAKTSKADIRGSVHMDEDKVALKYHDMGKVQSPEDIAKNPDFRHMMTLKQGKVRIVKAAPIFHKWGFTTELTFDDKIIDPDSMERILEYAANYGGFGDFRPTFGRATAEVSFG